ncbi:hypothetical protein [Nonomuraea fuscirosea]
MYMVLVSNQTTLKPEDRAVAITIGIQDEHLLWFEAQSGMAAHDRPISV